MGGGFHQGVARFQPPAEPLPGVSVGSKMQLLLEWMKGSPFPLGEAAKIYANHQRCPVPERLRNLRTATGLKNSRCFVESFLPFHSGI